MSTKLSESELAKKVKELVWDAAGKTPKSVEILSYDSNNGHYLVSIAFSGDDKVRGEFAPAGSDPDFPFDDIQLED